MNRLKFLILVAGLFAALRISAVTLPSSSYGGSGYTPSSSEVFSTSHGSTIKGSFFSLGDGHTTDDCVGDDAGIPPTGGSCSVCCEDLFDPVDEEANYNECVDKCTKGPFLPLDAPLWYMLALAALGAAFSVTMRKKLA